MKSAQAYIYSETIHHLDCAECGQSDNTNDTCRNLTKRQAVMAFKVEGWRFIMGKWLCEDCVRDHCE